MAKTARCPHITDTARKILKPNKDDENLCMFIGMLNCLRTEAERLAFAAGDPKFRGQNFKAFVSADIKEHHPNNYEEIIALKEEEGYNSRDMLRYLLYLKSQGFIKSFVWKGCNMREWHMNKIEQARDTKSYVLFAYGLTSEDRDEIKDQMKEHNKKPNAAEKKWEVYLGSTTEEGQSHGLGIGLERSELDDTLHAYIYDNGLRMRQEYTVDKLAERITFPFKVFVFDIEI